jgi:PAS domain S-box-containing protein
VTTGGTGAIMPKPAGQRRTRYFTHNVVQQQVKICGKTPIPVLMTTAGNETMQRALQELEQRWGLALQNAGFGVWDLDIPHQTVRYSPQWKTMLGYTGNDEPDSTAVWRGRVHPDDLQPMLDALHSHFDGRAPTYEMEFRLRAADGRYRWVLSRGQVVERDAEGHATRAVGTLTDLTDRREAERLRLERDRAEATARAKTDFLARMSHELRTPLNAVLGFAQLLSQRIGSPDLDEQRQYVGHIEQAGWHLLKLINDVLELSRIESGETALQQVPVALVPLLHSELTAMAELARTHDVQLLPPSVPDDARILGDGGRLQQVLHHLLTNAVVHNRAWGSVGVSVRPTHLGTLAAWAIAVSDTGVGIAASRLPHLFEPFNRLGRHASPTTGVGIGLVLARSLVLAMGGRLDVESVADQGSTFTVTLPANAA